MKVPFSSTLQKFLRFILYRYRNTTAPSWAIMFIDLFTLAVAFAVVEPAHLREPDEGLGDAVLGELIICGYTERDCENAPLETEIQRRHRLL